MTFSVGESGALVSYALVICRAEDRCQIILRSADSDRPAVRAAVLGPELSVHFKKTAQLLISSPGLVTEVVCMLNHGSSCELRGASCELRAAWLLLIDLIGHYY